MMYIDGVKICCPENILSRQATNTEESVDSEKVSRNEGDSGKVENKSVGNKKYGGGDGRE